MPMSKEKRKEYEKNRPKRDRSEYYREREKNRPKRDRPNRTKWDKVKFVTWDGEGRNTGKMIDDTTYEHIYTYLANSQGLELYNDNNSLKTDDIFELFCNSYLAESKNAVNVGFGLSYDCNMFLRDLPWLVLARLANNETNVPYKNYRITYVQRKFFRLNRFRNPNKLFKRIKHKDGTVSYKPDYDVEFILWDVIGFFQSSFLVAMNKWLPKDYPDRELILEGKSKRDSFETETIEYIRKYNQAELRALKAIMEQLYAAIDKLGLKLSRWDGAGAVATAMNQKHNVREAYITTNELGNEVRLTLPAEVQQAAEHAYFGGRIEMVQYGSYEGTVYHYDINSAYPSIQAELPSLNSGHWKHHLSEEPKGKKRKPQSIPFEGIGEFSIFKVKWDLNGHIYPFPLRNDLQQKILYPSKGQNWVWWPEIKAYLDNANRFNPPTNKKTVPFFIEEVWEYIPDNRTYKPFAFMKDYFYQRQALVNDTKLTGIVHGEEKVIKLGLNSMYGKTAQKVGYKAKEGRIPAYHNLAYAGYITSATRAKMFAACIQAPYAIIFEATDGIYSTAPLSLPISKTKELGLWEADTHDGIVVIQSGFYYVRNGDTWNGWSRGLDRLTGEGLELQDKIKAQIDLVKEKWKEGAEEIYLPCTRFITIKSGIQTTQNPETGKYEKSKVFDKWYSRWCGWHSLETNGTPGRALKIVPIGTKRPPIYEGAYVGGKVCTFTPWESLTQTKPEENCYGTERLGDSAKLPWKEAEIDGININIVSEEFMLGSEC